MTQRQAASGDGFDLQHAARREPGHRYLNTAAGDRGTRRDLELILQTNIDIHQNPEHDVLMVRGLLSQPDNRVRPHIYPGPASQRQDPMRTRPSNQFHEAEP